MGPTIAACEPPDDDEPGTDLVPYQGGVPDFDLEGATLEQISEAARAEYAHACVDLASALWHYIRLGEILLVARRRMDGPQWKPWLKTVGVTYDAAQRSMRLASYRDRLPAEITTAWRDLRGHIRPPSASRALAYLEGLSGVPPMRLAPAIRRAEGLRLFQEGMKQTAIADLMGVRKETVWRWVHPESRKRQQAASVRRARQRRQERAALQEKQRADERAARFASADTATQEAWNLVRRALAAAQAAINGKTGDVVRLREAMSHLYKAEDALDASIKDARRD